MRARLGTHAWLASRPARLVAVRPASEHGCCPALLGIFLIRRIMDEVNYALKENCHNELQLVKYVDEATGKAKSKTPEMHNGGAGLRA